MGTNGDRGVRVAAKGDRFGRERKVFGVMPFTVKVAAQDSDGRLFVIEQDNAYPGGPPRHVHHEQDEWFYAVRGRYLVEVGTASRPATPCSRPAASRTGGRSTAPSRDAC